MSYILYANKCLASHSYERSYTSFELSIMSTAARITKAARNTANLMAVDLKVMAASSSVKKSAVSKGPPIDQQESNLAFDPLQSRHDLEQAHFAQ